MKRRWNNLVKKWKLNGEDITSTCLWTKVDFNHVQIHENLNHESYENNNGIMKDEVECQYTQHVHEQTNDIDNHFKLRKNYFDLVLDKSTLDCALCSDDATSGLICNAYESLKADDGVYFVILFHHVDFIMPMLMNCPGVDWDVEHHVVPRKVDSPAFIERTNKSFQIKQDFSSFERRRTKEQKNINKKNERINNSMGENGTSASTSPQSSWSKLDETFQPDEEYRKFVNIFICRRKICKPSSSSQQLGDHLKTKHLDRNKVRIHIHDCNDVHFKEHNPMITHVRKEHIKNLFMERIILGQEPKQEQYDICNESNCDEILLKTSFLPLQTCYDILFTEAEKEHLTFEYFMEDYVAFSQEQEQQKLHLLCDQDGMTYEAAIQFLEAMQ